MKKLLFILLFFPLIVASQTRYLDDVFTDVTVYTDVSYATNITVMPVQVGGLPGPAPILCDIYTPSGDTETNRPVVILAHTGSFLPAVINGQATGSKTDSSIVEQCMRWAKKGYVAVAMDNRLGWDPLNTDQNVRTGSLIQAAYRGVHDAKAMVRFLRMTEDQGGNPYGINPNKIVLGGHGTGAYIALGYAGLDNENELYLPKFLDFTDPANPDPYVYPTVYGNIDGTNATYWPNMPGHPFSGLQMNIPNNPSYSSDINMAFNLGGAIPDISWLEAGDVPIVSFHCHKDPYAPIDTGDVIVPTTGDFVVEVMGSRTVQHYSNMYGNNDVFVNAGFTDAFTNAANINNDGYEGLNVFVMPAPDSVPNMFGEYYEEPASPWDWWNNTYYDAAFSGYHGAPAGYGAANSILGNPDMSAAKGRAYIDTIQGYLNPRMYVALNLGGASSIHDAVKYSTNVYPNPAKDKITITNNNFPINSIDIFNSIGQKVISKEVNNNEGAINIKDLKKGMYILKVKSNNSSIEKKIIIE